MTTSDEQYQRFLMWRGLEADDVCPRCQGSGYRAYGSTATWHGGIGGQMITTDVCDLCWGSGSKSRPWPNWRHFTRPKHESGKAKLRDSGKQVL